MRAFVLDEAAVRKVDRSGAAEHLKSLPDQVARGLQLGSALGPLAAHRRVVVVGMGGSGIAGAVLAAGLITLTRTIPTIIASFRESMKEGCNRHSRRRPVDEAVWEDFGRSLFYRSVDYGDVEAFKELKKELEEIISDIVPEESEDEQ